MEVRVLGAHKLESLETRHTCFLIDGVLGLDAGSLASSLSLEEQTQIKAVLLTHHHFDHIRDIPTLGLALLDQPGTVDVYALQETLEAVHEHLINGELYPDFTKGLGSDIPKYRFNPINAGEIFQVLDYQIKPIPVSHPVPCVGFVIKSRDGGCFTYTGDTDGDILRLMGDELAPKAVFVDMSFPNRMVDLARLTGHMTPGLLRTQLEEALAKGMSTPKVIGVHLDPAYQDEVIGEFLQLSSDLGIDLEIGYEGMRLVL